MDFSAVVDTRRATRVTTQVGCRPSGLVILEGDEEEVREKTLTSQVCLDFANLSTEHSENFPPIRSLILTDMRAGNVQEEEEEEGLTPTPRLQQAAPVAPLPKPTEPEAAEPEQPEDQGKTGPETEQAGAKDQSEGQKDKCVAKKEKEKKEQTKVPASTPAKQSGRPAARAALQESTSKANSATPGVVSLASLGFATGGGKAKSKGKGQKAAKGGAKDVTASASKKKKPAAVVEETPSKRRRKKLYKPTFNTPAPSFEDVSDVGFFCFGDSLRRASAFAFLSARLCRNLLSAKAFAVATDSLANLADPNALSGRVLPVH